MFVQFSGILCFYNCKCIRTMCCAILLYLLLKGQFGLTICTGGNFLVDEPSLAQRAEFD